jgi:hypothetical protein
MAWRKLGQVFAGPTGRHPALLTHAALPTPYTLERDLVRVFYSGRDASNRSSVGSVVLRLGEQPKIEEAPPDPMLVPGGVGGFDDAGIGVGSVVHCDGEDRLYYMGWNVGGSAPWRNAIGVAFGDARSGRFERRYLGPILDRSPIDPFSLSYPWVLRLGEGNWRMWYGSHLEWGSSKADMSHAIRAASSSDGLAWRPEEKICIPSQGDEIATVRPSVLSVNGGFEMAFAARGLESPYAIRRAVSVDGVSWRRVHEAIAPDQPWESGALTYPAVFEQNGRRWMLFNGQGFGKTGFGLAVWEEG